MSWERIVACQCISGVEYGLMENCSERTYFTALIAKALELANSETGAPKSTLLKAIVQAISISSNEEDPVQALEDVLKITKVKYGQLMLKRNPVISSRPPPADDPDYVPAQHYEMYEVTEVKAKRRRQEDTVLQFVQAPRSEVRTTLPKYLHGGSGFADFHASQKPSQPLHPSHSPHATYSVEHVASFAVHPQPASAAASLRRSAHAIHASHSAHRLDLVYVVRSAALLSHRRSSSTRSSRFRFSHHCFVCP